MKRGNPPQRKTPLKRGKPLKRTPFKRNGKPVKSAPIARRYKPTGPARDVVECVYDRSAHSCERCGRIVGPRRGIDHHLHHRRPRAMGGTDRPETNWPSNVVLLDPDCHAWIESNRVEADAWGWLVPQHANPAAAPVFIADRGWTWLTTGGEYSSHPPKRGDDGA